MSAPDTNTQDEEKKHRSSLLGIKASIAYGVGLLAIFAIYVIATSNEPDVLSEDDEAGSSLVGTDTESNALEGYEEENYQPGGNSTGSVQIENE